MISKITSRTEEMFKNKGKARLQAYRDDYMKIKSNLNNISEDPTEDIKPVLSAISELLKNLDQLFLNMNYKDVQAFLENRDAITVRESWPAYFEKFNS